MQLQFYKWFKYDKTIDPATVWGLPSTGEKAKLLIGWVYWHCNSIGPILAAAAKGNSMNKAGQDRGWNCSLF